MSTAEIRQVVLDVLADIAPDVDLAVLDPATDLQRQCDLDSFDFLNLMVALSERLGVDVPEQDYAELTTLDQCTSYLEQRVAPPVG